MIASRKDIQEFINGACEPGIVSSLDWLPSGLKDRIEGLLMNDVPGFASLTILACVRGKLEAKPEVSNIRESESL